MRICRYLAAVVFLAPCAAAAQTTTADGVQSLIRGDYATAIRILLPLADDEQQPDPIAQFLMATMYRSGRGVMADPIRACGYYLKAATPPSPVMVQSLALARMTHQDSPLMLAFCSAARADIRPDPPAASLTLAPDHSVQIDRRGITADGVDAFVRGDYQRAVEIFKPIAEAPGPADAVAQFFMAMMYEGAIGVSGDGARACALYEHVAHGQGLFGLEAMELGQALRSSMRPEEIQDCQYLLGEGFNPTFQPVSFALEPGQWVSLDVRAATISYQGTEERFDLGIRSPGIVFLPVEHTALTVGGSQSTRRHFIEISMWVPARNMQTWTLQWLVYEVVRNEWVVITSEKLTTASAAQPPASASSDVHALAHLRVNDSGNAEWTVVAGPNPRSSVIESDAERQLRPVRWTPPGRSSHATNDARAAQLKRPRSPSQGPVRGAVAMASGALVAGVAIAQESGERKVTMQDLPAAVQHIHK